MRVTILWMIRDYVLYHTPWLNPHKITANRKQQNNIFNGT
jgi:hypothetical protein